MIDNETVVYSEEVLIGMLRRKGWYLFGYTFDGQFWVNNSYGSEFFRVSDGAVFSLERQRKIVRSMPYTGRWMFHLP